MPAKSDAGTPAADDDEPIYSIRFIDTPETPCACGRNSVGSGPVGYPDEDAICDACLLESSIELGLILALIAVTRAFAKIGRDSPEAWPEAIQELGTFARVYECAAAKSGPSRLFRVPDFSESREARSRPSST